MNRYDIPFILFVGVNDHGQSSLLGATLFSNKTTKTYTWVYHAWLQCMDGQALKAIITNHDRAMKKAIEIALPNT